MLSAIEPVTGVLASIWPVALSKPLSFVVFEAAFITLFVRPRHLSLSVHFVLFPISYIYSSIFPSICALPMHEIFNYLSTIVRAILVLQLSNAVFKTLLIISLIFCAIRPCLYSSSMLFVVEPPSCVFGTLDAYV